MYTTPSKKKVLSGYCGMAPSSRTEPLVGLPEVASRVPCHSVQGRYAGYTFCTPQWRAAMLVVPSLDPALSEDAMIFSTGVFSKQARSSSQAPWALLRLFE